MKVGTNVATSHTLVLDESEQFNMTTKTDRPITIHVERVYAEQLKLDGEWDVRAVGRRVLKSGKIGSGEKLDLWAYRNTFRRDVMVELFAELSQEVQDTLHALGVTV